jgi:hypothetical protein
LPTVTVEGARQPHQIACTTALWPPGSSWGGQARYKRERTLLPEGKVFRFRILSAKIDEEGKYGAQLALELKVLGAGEYGGHVFTHWSKLAADEDRGQVFVVEDGKAEEKFRRFVVDRNICHFLWYGGVAGEGLRSVGADGEFPPSKSVFSILPIARRLSAWGFRAPALVVV